MAEQDLDRNEAATPHKLQRARERGQTAKSNDVVSAGVFVVAVAFLASQGADMAAAQFRFDMALLLKAGRMDAGGAGLLPLIDKALRDTMRMLVPLFGALMIAAIVANLMQTGPILSFEPLKADANRLNPVQGLKKLFSLRVLFDAARAVAKLVLLVGVAAFGLQAIAPRLASAASLSGLGQLRLLQSHLGSIGFRMALVLGLIALADLVYTRREFARKMRMSQRERKDEAKQREGDPRIRARMRELRRELARRSLALRNTRHADVLITNPTHLAVALQYRHGRMSSPMLLAKGAGQLASAMRAIAAQHGIPVVRNPALARKLFRELPVDRAVPPDLYADVARIIVWVFAMRERKAARART